MRHFSSILFRGNIPIVRVWERRRPEWWRGWAWQPESWLALLSAGALGWSLWRERELRRV